jgi:uncharacterized protein (TIGR03435 family)
MNMRATLAFFALALAAFGQTPDTRPAFEAAFLKPNTTGSGGSSSHETNGQIVMVNLTLKRLVERAYNVKPYQVTGPDWMENLRFDVTAKYPENSPNKDRPTMLLTMLEDRFKLATHTETKLLPGYELVLVKSGLKIKPVEKGSSGTSDNSSNNLETLQVTSRPMTDFADFLSRRLGSTVVDATKVDGLYSFELHWALDESNGAVDRGAGDFAAIQEAIGTLGLHLQATKVPVQIVVVDHIERVPTEN